MSGLKKWIKGHLAGSSKEGVKRIDDFSSFHIWPASASALNVYFKEWTKLYFQSFKSKECWKFL